MHNTRQAAGHIAGGWQILYVSAHVSTGWSRGFEICSYSSMHACAAASALCLKVQPSASAGYNACCSSSLQAGPLLHINT